MAGSTVVQASKPATLINVMFVCPSRKTALKVRRHYL